MKTDTVELKSENISSVADVKHRLSAMEPQALLQQNAGQLLVAVNQEMGNDSTTVNDGDEVALFPPVTGG